MGTPLKLNLPDASGIVLADIFPERAIEVDVKFSPVTVPEMVKLPVPPYRAW